MWKWMKKKSNATIRTTTQKAGQELKRYAHNSHLGSRQKNLA